MGRDRFTHAFLLGGITNIDACARDPVSTGKVNVDGYLRMIEDLLAAGVAPIFASSDAVYHDRPGVKSEDEERKPILTYGKQKLIAVENHLLSAGGAWLVARQLSTVIGTRRDDGTLVDQWLSAIESGEEILYARDQVFSPVDVDNVITALIPTPSLRYRPSRLIGTTWNDAALQTGGPPEFREARMGIAHYVAEAIIREHKFKSITGDVLLLGRQTMLFSPQYAVAMIRGHGIEPAPMPLDDSIIDRQTLAADGHSYIRDDAFFRLLGVAKSRALDHRDYEGAEIIHDLNVPVPDRLEGIADFILDGSTLDNVWDAATTVRNVARLLRPGGRFFSINMGSNHFTPYTVLTPQWLLDYFVVNHFADCKVGMIVHGADNKRAVFTPDPERLLLSGSRALNNLTFKETMGILVLAEKGEESTWDKIPIQQQYRPDDAMAAYRASLTRMASSDRPHPVRSTGFLPLGGNKDGWLYVDEDGRLKPDMTKPPLTLRVMRRLRAATAALMGR